MNVSFYPDIFCVVVCNRDAKRNVFNVFSPLVSFIKNQKISLEGKENH